MNLQFYRPWSAIQIPGEPASMTYTVGHGSVTAIKLHPGGVVIVSRTGLPDVAITPGGYGPVAAPPETPGSTPGASVTTHGQTGGITVGTVVAPARTERASQGKPGGKK